MKHLFPIFLLIGAALWGCSDKEDVLPDQHNKIVAFLRDTHDPKLLSKEAADSSQDVNPEYYTTSGGTAYRYIKHMYDGDRETYPLVEYGDQVELTFRMYVFDFKRIATTGETITMPYFSNDPLLEASYYESGLTEGYWIFEPLVVKLGETQILKGLESSLPGCRERDTVEVYMTYNMAYGDKLFGIIPKESPVAVLFSVDKVTKK